jgi:GNAT superfamily N-acetyltransferase
MTLREAGVSDIPALHHIRLSVKENRLSDPRLITATDYKKFLTDRGMGWVVETDSKIIGFAIIDLREKNIWAIFVDPSYEKQGAGKMLMGKILGWYFSQWSETLWLSTAPGTRAEKFYRKFGWQEKGVTGKNEIMFVYSSSNWRHFSLKKRILLTKRALFSIFIPFASKITL